MKYLLVLLFIIFLGNCGGSSKNYTFKATVIDGYLVESNVSIYDKKDKLLITTITNNKASFSHKNSENDFLYIKATSGIDTMNNEVFSSSLYGIAIRGTSTVISPLSSLVWAYHKSNKATTYKDLAENVRKALKLTKNILTFDPIANISDRESSKIIKYNITLEFVARLINSALGGNFEDITYGFSYVKLLRYEDMSFLYSDSFIDSVSRELRLKYNYLNEDIVNLKLSSLKSSIAYIVDEINYLEADNKELLKKSYKASYILTLPIIKEASLMQDIQVRDTIHTSEYFNDINNKIHALDMSEIIKGLKIMGGFRGVLYRINDITRETKTIKASYFSESFLNKGLLLKSSVLYDKLSDSVVSGAPSQDDFKDNIIKNTIFLNMENQDILNPKTIEQVQSQVSLSVGFSKKGAIKTNAELFLKKDTIEENKKAFKNQAQSLVTDIKTSYNNTLLVSKIDTSIIIKNNKDSLIFYKDDISIKDELLHVAIRKQNKISELVRTSNGDTIIIKSSELELIQLQEDELQEKISKNKLSKTIIDYKTKISIEDDKDIKETLEATLEIFKTSEKSSENSITAIQSQEAKQESFVKSINKFTEDKTSSKYAKLLKEHTEVQSEKKQEKNIRRELKKAKSIYDEKIEKIEKEKEEEEEEYATNLNTLSTSLTNGEEIDTKLISTLNKELRAIASLKAKLLKVKVTKKDLAKAIDFSFNGLKVCFNKDDNDLFSITITKPTTNTNLIEAKISNIPTNTIFSNNALKRKKDDGINSFHMPLGEYNISITISNTITDAEKTKPANFEIKETCIKDGSLALKAPLQIPNIPNLSAPELNTSSDLPNPNSGQNPPKIDDGGKPPKNN